MTTTRPGRRRLAPLVLALVAAGCSAQPPAQPAGLAPVGDERVGLTEWSVVTQGRPLLPGQPVLEVTNAGATVHDLAVEGPGGRWQTPLLRPGEHAELRLRVQPGEKLKIWCTVEGHELAGMLGTLTVASSPGTGG